MDAFRWVTGGLRRSAPTISAPRIESLGGLTEGGDEPAIGLVEQLLPSLTAEDMKQRRGRFLGLDRLIGRLLAQDRLDSERRATGLFPFSRSPRRGNPWHPRKGLPQGSRNRTLNHPFKDLNSRPGLAGSPIPKAVYNEGIAGQTRPGIPIAAIRLRRADKERQR